MTPQLAAHEYDEFRRYLEEASGIVLGENREQFVTRRLVQLMYQLEIENFTQLMSHLRVPGSNRLHRQIVDVVTTRESVWFQDSYPFDALKHELLPQLSLNSSQPLRIWSAASACGQEAYSISMAVQEYLNYAPGTLPDEIEILGTDISATALSIANRATYDTTSLSRGISEERKKQFFLFWGDRWKLRPEVTQRTRFREFNLLNSFNSLGKFDIIFCRNVLIYFSSELKSDILNRIAGSLNPGGYLIVGAAELPTDYSNAFIPVQTRKGVVYRLK